MVNVVLLESVMDKINTHPELHNQQWYFTPTECGTAACFAGWTCLLAGYEQVWPWTGSTMVKGKDIVDRASAPCVARRVLDITSDEAGILFDARNRRSMLELMVKDLCNGDLLREPEYYRELVS